MKRELFVIDKDVIGNLVFISFLYVFVGYFFIDVTQQIHRSISFWVLAAFVFLYGVLFKSNTHFFIKQTQYELPFSYAVLLFGIWCCSIDYVSSPEQLSSYNGIILIVTSFLGLQLFDYIGNHFKEKRLLDSIPSSVQVIKYVTLFVLFRFVAFFLMNGTWDWSIHSVSELIHIFQDYTDEHWRRY